MNPFSLEAATVRQDYYGHRFGDGSYTPEMVVDGMVGLVGSHRDEVNAAIERAKRGLHPATDVNVDKAGENVAISIGSGVGRGKVLLIGFDHEHTTKIGRGENRGRALAESNVVRSIRPVGEWSGKPLEISAQFPEGQDVAVVIESSDGGIVGAARLPSGSNSIAFFPWARWTYRFIGNQAQVDGTNAVALGFNANASGAHSTVNATDDGNANAAVYGVSVSIGSAGNVAIGNTAIRTAWPQPANSSAFGRCGSYQPRRISVRPGQHAGDTGMSYP